MTVYIDQNTRVIVQGITGNQGAFHAGQMLEYGTSIVAGVTPGKKGKEIEGIPVYNTVFSAVEEHQADASILFTPAPFAKDAALEALEAGIKILVLIPEHIPLGDAMEIMAAARYYGAVVVGPNTFGVVSSGKCKIGIMPNRFFVPGPVGVVSRSGTLCYEIVGQLLDKEMGTSTVVGMGGDRVVGLNFIEVLKEFEKDPDTGVVVMVGEIGGSAEEEAAAYIKENVSKPVVAYIAGKSAPSGKRMGHAGAIIERGRGSFASKESALRECGAYVADLPPQIPDLVEKALQEK